MVAELVGAFIWLVDVELVCVEVGVVVWVIVALVVQEEVAELVGELVWLVAHGEVHVHHEGPQVPSSRKRSNMAA